MGRSSGKKKKKQSGHNSDPKNVGVVGDPEMLLAASQELKDEGNKLFQRRDYEGALFKYEKALRLLPRSHIDVAYIRSNMAACYMQMGICNYPRAVHECNLSLEVSPEYTKALIKRAKCYEGLCRFELALRDIKSVLRIEPHNLTALEIAERLQQHTESPTDCANGSTPHEGVGVEPLCASLDTPVQENIGFKETKVEDSKVKAKTNKTVDKLVVEEKPSNMKDEMKKTVKYEKALKLLHTKMKQQTESQTDWANGSAPPKVVGVEPPCASLVKPFQERAEKKKKKSRRSDEKKNNKAVDKLVVEEKLSNMEDEMKTTVKLVYGEDIRWAHLPLNCSLYKLREVIRGRYQNLKSVLVKYKDNEGDMVTVTSDEELRWAEASASSEGFIRLYIVEVEPEQDPFFQKLSEKDACVVSESDAVTGSVKKSREISRASPSVDEWMIQFAQLFKSYAGFSADACLDLHETGVELYSETIEEAVTTEEAQGLFDMAAIKFQEMAALALFNWGNVHMARARRRVDLTEESHRGDVFSQVKDAYEWAQRAYIAAGKRYEDALRTKPDFYEAHLALAKQQFEQAKLAWYYARTNDADLQTWSYTEILKLYNSAESNLEMGMQMWVEVELQFRENLSYNDVSADELADQAAKIRSQIHVLWGSMLYERSVMEYKLQLPMWEECLEVAIEKFELAGASQSELAVMVKNHCSNDSAIEGVGFKIEEIVQAWNEMDEAKTWYSSAPSFRMEPLLRRRASKLYSALDLV